MNIHVLVLDGVFDTGLAAVLDALSMANQLAGMAGLPAAPFRVKLVGVRPTVKTAQGLAVPVAPIPRRGAPDLVVVPAIAFMSPEPLRQALARPATVEAMAALRTYVQRGAGLATACIGTFVLAEAGLLDDHEATTTWWLAPFFRHRYPGVRLDESRMIIESGRITTAGAALGHVDLALWIIRRQSPSLAALAARYLILDARPSQSAYALVEHMAHSDPLVERFERWARSALARGFSLDEAAAAAATSKRTLARHLREVLGRSPLAYFQDLRVERAVHLLKTTAQTVEEVAGQVGYADGVTLRSLLRRRLGSGVKAIRGHGRDG